MVPHSYTIDDVRSKVSKVCLKISDSPDKMWHQIEALIGDRPIFKRTSKTHVHVRMPESGTEPTRWIVLSYEEVKSRLRIIVRDIATEPSTEIFEIEVSVGKDGDSDQIVHRITDSPLDRCEQIVEKILSDLEDPIIAKPSREPITDAEPPPKKRDHWDANEPTISRWSMIKQIVSSFDNSARTRKLGKRLLRWTWNLAALTAIVCGVILLLPLDRTSASRQSSASEPNRLASGGSLNSGVVSTHGHLPTEQMKSIQLLGSYAGVAVHEGDQPHPGQAPSVPSFYLFSALDCQDCGAVEHMTRNLAKTRKGYVIPVGFSTQMDQKNTTAAALSQVYCTTPRQDAYRTWEQLRLYWSDKNQVAQCTGWDDMAKVSALAQLLIDAHAGTAQERSRRPILVAPNGAFHVGGFNATTTPTDIAVWLDQNTIHQAISFSPPIQANK